MDGRAGCWVTGRSLAWLRGIKDVKKKRDGGDNGILGEGGLKF